MALNTFSASLESPEKKMVCCGNSYNDIRMLQYAAVGVAMKNAPENVKTVANFVTEHDNDHDGVVEVIEHFFPYAKGRPNLA